MSKRDIPAARPNPFARERGNVAVKDPAGEQIVSVGRWRGPFLLSSPRFYQLIAEPDNLDALVGAPAPR
jgi:hypothetical protein